MDINNLNTDPLVVQELVYRLMDAKDLINHLKRHVQPKEFGDASTYLGLKYIDEAIKKATEI